MVAKPNWGEREAEAETERLYWRGEYFTAAAVAGEQGNREELYSETRTVKVLLCRGKGKKKERYKALLCGIVYVTWNKPNKKIIFFHRKITELSYFFFSISNT